MRNGSRSAILQLMKDRTKLAPPWPPAPGYEYCYRLGKTWHIGKLERINAQDPDGILYDFGNISVQLMMIEKPAGAQA